MYIIDFSPPPFPRLLRLSFPCSPTSPRSSSADVRSHLKRRRETPPSLSSVWGGSVCFFWGRGGLCFNRSPAEGSRVEEKAGFSFPFPVGCTFVFVFYCVILCGPFASTEETLSTLLLHIKVLNVHTKKRLSSRFYSRLIQSDAKKLFVPF